MRAFDAFRRADRSADIVLTIVRSLLTLQEDYRRYSMEHRRVAGLENKAGVAYFTRLGASHTRDTAPPIPTLKLAPGPLKC